MKYSMTKSKNKFYSISSKLTDNEHLSITIDVIIFWIKQDDGWFVGWIYIIVVNIKALMSRH